MAVASARSQSDARQYLTVERRYCYERSRRTSTLLIRRRDPGGNLGARVDPQLVQDAADVAVDGAFGDEKTRSDLLVAQALGDQPRDLRFTLREQSRHDIDRHCRCDKRGFTQRERDGGVPNQV